MATTFCTDIDLLHWEPTLLREAQLASQTLLAGTGDLAGTAFTISAGSFEDAHVDAEQVIVLAGSINGCFPIVKIESPTELTLSVLYDGLFPDDPETEVVASPVNTISGLPFAVRTFWAQRNIVSEFLLRAGSVSDPATILNPAALRRACALGTLQMIYSALAAAADDPADFSVRADLYERLYRRALRSTRLEIDTNGDGEIDQLRDLSIVEFRRS